MRRIMVSRVCPRTDKLYNNRISRAFNTAVGPPDMNGGVRTQVFTKITRPRRITHAPIGVLQAEAWEHPLPWFTPIFTCSKDLPKMKYYLDIRGGEERVGRGR